MGRARVSEQELQLVNPPVRAEACDQMGDGHLVTLHAACRSKRIRAGALELDRELGCDRRIEVLERVGVTRLPCSAAADQKGAHEESCARGHALVDTAPGAASFP